MTSYRRSSAESGHGDAYTIIEEIVKDQGVVRRYAKGRFLGKGGFAKCYEFTNLETKKVIAAKVIPKSSLTRNRAKQKLMSEIKIHKSLRHQNIVGFDHFFEDHENVYILLEMCTNQTMNELIKRRKQLKEIEVQCYLMQIIQAMKYLHSHRVIHRDLKLGNLFLSDKMEIKLGDFGLATKLEFDNERKKTICGTPNYIAPEILEGKESGHSYEVDVWSFGVIAYTLLIGKPPFETNDVKTTYRRIKNNEYSFPENVVISSQAKSLIKSILITDPASRLTVDEIINHEFFTTGTIPKLLPVSTLACPPSASYVSQFKLQTPSTIQAQKGTELTVGRSQSPKQFENTSPQTGLSMMTSTASSTAYNPISLKSHQSVGLKEKKDFVNTYRTGSQTNGLVNNEQVPSKNSQTGGGSSITKNVECHQSNSANPNQQAQIMTGSTSLTKNSSSQAVNLNNVSGGNSGGVNTYQSTNKQPQNQQQGIPSTNKNGIEKYSSSSNLNSQNNSLNTNCVNTYSRARSEKLNTQPTSSLLHSYGLSQHYGNGSSLIASSTLTQNLSGTHLPQTIQPEITNLQGPDLWVKKWVDYSTKYGLGYLLNNGQTGVFFNDSTKIILNPLTEEFEYYERRADKQNIGTQHTLQTYPNELQKKVTLLQHFRVYLEGEDKEKNKELIKQHKENNKDDKRIYVKKWLRTKHAILFLFNNKVAQVIFQDQTEIVLSNELRVVTYVNKKHQRLTFPLSSAMESTNLEMSKRLKHTKDILSHMFSNGSSSQQIKSGAENTNTNPLQPSEILLGNTGTGLSETRERKNSAGSSSANGSSQNKGSQPKPLSQQRENLHFSKQGLPINPVAIPHLLTQPISYNNYTSNENINTLMGMKNQAQPSSASQSSSQTKSSLYGAAATTNISSGNKKEITSVLSNNLSTGNQQNSQNILKTNSSLGRLGSANSGVSSSLQNLNNFNNYILTSRKTDS